jgi:benzoyl-CoA reductase/2-hydroxyglutaryl-CoA dehydratase subunit BcrC/BadD/HgdB
VPKVVLLEALEEAWPKAEALEDAWHKSVALEEAWPKAVALAHKVPKLVLLEALEEAWPKAEALEDAWHKSVALEEAWPKAVALADALEEASAPVPMATMSFAPPSSPWSPPSTRGAACGLEGRLASNWDSADVPVRVRV